MSDWNLTFANSVASEVRKIRLRNAGFQDDKADSRRQLRVLAESVQNGRRGQRLPWIDAAVFHNSDKAVQAGEEEVPEQANLPPEVPELLLRLDKFPAVRKPRCADTPNRAEVPN